METYDKVLPIIIIIIIIFLLIIFIIIFKHIWQPSLISGSIKNF